MNGVEKVAVDLLIICWTAVGVALLCCVARRLTERWKRRDTEDRSDRR